MHKPNDVHQADLLYLPHDVVKRKTYKYALTVIEEASRYKEAVPLTNKTAVQVAEAFKKIYKRGQLKWPRIIKVDPGKEFMAAVNALFKNKKTQIQRGIAGNHRAQGMVERFNRTLAERLFGHQYAQEMTDPHKRSREWVERLPKVIEALNDETTRLIGLKPKDAIKIKSVKQSPATSYKRPVGSKEKQLEVGSLVRYLYAPGEAEADTHRRATDPIWSIKTYTIKNSMMTSKQPVLYWIENGPKRSFVREELQIVPSYVALPPKLK